jgi:hypothetical protein
MLRVNHLNGFGVGEVGAPGSGGGSGETGANLDAAVIPFAVDVSSVANQSITSSAYGGGTPKLAMFLESETASLKANQATADIGFGAADGTSQFVAYANSDDNVAGAGTDRIVGMTDQCLIRLVSTTIGSESDFNAFVTNGVEIDHTDDWPSAVRETAIVLGGSDLTVGVGTVTPVTGAGATVALGWQPDAIIFFMADGLMTDTIAIGFRAIQGFAAWDSGGTLSEVCCGVRADTGATRLYRTFLANDASIASLSATADAYTFKGNVTRSGTGFTVTSDATAAACGYVAIKVAGGKCKAGTWTLPTGTGASTKSGVGFKPKLVLIAGTERTAVGGPSSGTLFGMAALSREPRAASIFGSWVSDGAASNTDTRHTVDDQGIFGLLDAGSTDFDIELTSMDSDGWTVNVVDAPAGAYLWPYLAIG